MTTLAILGLEWWQILLAVLLVALLLFWKWYRSKSM